MTAAVPLTAAERLALLCDCGGVTPPDPHGEVCATRGEHDVLIGADDLVSTVESILAARAAAQPPRSAQLSYWEQSAARSALPDAASQHYAAFVGAEAARARLAHAVEALAADWRARAGYGDASLSWGADALEALLAEQESGEGSG